jgi:hypothetical protein
MTMMLGGLSGKAMLAAVPLSLPSIIFLSFCRADASLGVGSAAGKEDANARFRGDFSSGGQVFQL